MAKLEKVQTNLHPEAVAEIRLLAKKMYVSEASLIRGWIYKKLEEITGVPVDYGAKKKPQPPKFCTQCGKDKTELGEPVILVSNNKWQCYECGTKGVWK